ncbi:MAG TPA: YkgJ family cysteine cluster protein [Thermoprotei archaeon]|nr:YkgJ family cysteine cluster protein [Thermoprotei archaeon]
MDEYLKLDCFNCRVRCCLEQRVILSERDIDLLIEAGYKLEYFAVKKGRYYYLREYGGRCIFYDVDTGLCRIYKYRPLVCRLYPLVYQDGNVILDVENCPEASKIDEEMMWNAVPDLIELVYRLKMGYRKYRV